MITVDTSATLRRAQDAMARARRTNDTELKDAAESVMSALILVLKFPQARLPAAVGKHLEKINGN
jgi:hypothetical protein